MDKPVSGPDVPDDAHLPPERLAALADESPTAAEATHLAACPTCGEEVEAYRALLQLTRGERDRLSEPLTTWAGVSGALAGQHLLDDGTLHAGASHGPRSGRRPGRPVSQIATRAAAALILLAAGVAIGRATADHSGHQPGAPAPTASASPYINASNRTPTPPTSDTAAFASKQEALDALAQSEARYRHAVAYLMETDSSALTEGPDGYRTRLAALEQVERTTRAALAAAPNDPVLTQWYISTVGAHQATIRQLVHTRAADQQHRY